MPVIQIENLKYRYPHRKRLALDGISLSVEKGEFIGIIGRNGAGKSTLCQAVMGLVPQFYKGAYGGRVSVNGVLSDRTPVFEMCRQVGLVFQNPFNQLSGAKETVYEEVAFGMENLGVPRGEMRSRIEETLKELDIWQYRERNPFELSGGQMQRVAIASVMVMRPDVMILDEPTSQLDPQGTEDVFLAVDRMAQAGMTILMVEQKLEKLAEYCSRLLLLHDGKQVAYDAPGKLFARDDLEAFGIREPVFTRLCKAGGWRLPGGAYPVTAQEAREAAERAGGVILAPRRETADRALHASPEDGGAGRGQTPCFAVQNLDFSYAPKIPIFQRLNLFLDKRPTALIGQNGAGKTTLARLLKGLLKPLSGTIYFSGEDIAGKTVAMLAGKVGYVFQNPDDQIFKYKVLDEVMFGPLNMKMSRERAEAEALKALKATGLSEKADRNPYDLELHERKMVAIASVLAMNTDVIILDEPTIAQDYPGRARIGKIIRQAAGEGRLVIAILHDMDFAAENFERVIVMAHGKALCDGSAREVFKRDAALREAGLQKPCVMELCAMLGIEEDCLTVEEFLDRRRGPRDHSAPLLAESE